MRCTSKIDIYVLQSSYCNQLQQTQNSAINQLEYAITKHAKNGKNGYEKIVRDLRINRAG